MRASIIINIIVLVYLLALGSSSAAVLVGCMLFLKDYFLYKSGGEQIGD